LNYSDLEKLRISASLTTNAAELHGLISSRLCFGINNFQDLTSEDTSDDKSVTSIQIQEFNNAFLKMIEDAKDQFKKGGFSFEPLLPNDSEPIEYRALGLASWCQGFVDGYGMSVAELEIEIDKLGDGEAAEIIEDFAQISTLDSNSISDEQDEEIAFMELVEYVRVSVQLLYEGFRGYTNES
tara:strand:- start:868 stop:1416 length:549 start_codon:yes stop_codon:yes gene_type:complete